MTDATITTFITGLPLILTALGTLLAACGTLYVSIRSRAAVKATETKVDASLRQNDALLERADEIHVNTNGHLSKLTAAFEVALEKIAGLERMVATLTEAKRVADAVAEASRLEKEKEK